MLVRLISEIKAQPNNKSQQLVFVLVTLVNGSYVFLQSKSFLVHVQVQNLTSRGQHLLQPHWDYLRVGYVTRFRGSVTKNGIVDHLHSNAIFPFLKQGQKGWAGPHGLERVICNSNTEKEKYQHHGKNHRWTGSKTFADTYSALDWCAEPGM